MNHAPVHLGPRELREVYAEPFRAAIAEAGLATVMNSYASVDGVAVRRVEGDPRRPAARRARVHRRGRRRLLHDRAADHAPPRRRDTGRGRPARARGRPRHGAARSSSATARRCAALVEAGEVDVALVDRSVRRVLALKESLGLFDQPYVDEDAVDARVRPAGQTARSRARPPQKSIVLLENDGELLPLRARARASR